MTGREPSYEIRAFFSNYAVNHPDNRPKIMTSLGESTDKEKKLERAYSLLSVVFLSASDVNPNVGGRQFSCLSASFLSRRVSCLSASFLSRRVLAIGDFSCSLGTGFLFRTADTIIDD
jgi:hypothetical protein